LRGGELASRGQPAQVEFERPQGDVSHMLRTLVAPAEPLMAS
jgi:hypothetical protein